MRKTTIVVSVEVEIYDRAETLKACRERMRADGVKPWRGLSAIDAAQYLIDPGSLPGCTITQSWLGDAS